jgi:hypothetical protein
MAWAAGAGGVAARLREGAARAGDDVRALAPGEKAPRAGPIARARAGAWLGVVGEGVERVVDRTLIEVARESLDGVQRGAIERRYLVDLGSGEVLREERARTEPAPSLGPCPRFVVAGLAEVEEGASPRRVSLLQYTVTLDVPSADLERVHANAVRRVAMLVDQYREAITAWPALAEPVQVIACAGIEDGFLVDAVGDPLPIANREDPGAAAALDGAARAGEVEWICGRILDADGAVRIVPLSYGGARKIARLR